MSHYGYWRINSVYMGLNGLRDEISYYIDFIYKTAHHRYQMILSTFTHLLFSSNRFFTSVSTSLFSTFQVASLI